MRPDRVLFLALTQRMRALIWLLLASACTTAFAATLDDGARCPFRVPTVDVQPLYTQAEARITQWRAALATTADPAPIRQQMGDYAIVLMQRANTLEANGSDSAARSLRGYVRRQLPDTDWRIQYNANAGDLGAIEARIAWLRSDPTPDMEKICALAQRGDAIGGIESAYRLVSCVTDKSVILERMLHASDRGHAAAMEAVGRLCLAGKLTGACSFERLCLAAQAGRLGAAATVGWHLTGEAKSDDVDGAAWLQRAASAGDVSAQNNLGEWHERQIAGTASTALALQWYRKAAAQGLPAAMVNAARLLSVGTAAQCAEARVLLGKAKAAGLAQAGIWAQELRCP